MEEGGLSLAGGDLDGLLVLGLLGVLGPALVAWVGARLAGARQGSEPDWLEHWWHGSEPDWLEHWWHGSEPDWLEHWWHGSEADWSEHWSEHGSEWPEHLWLGSVLRRCQALAWDSGHPKELDDPPTPVLKGWEVAKGTAKVPATPTAASGCSTPTPDLYHMRSGVHGYTECRDKANMYTAYVCMYVCIHIYICECVCVHIHIHIYMHMYVCVCMYICMCACTKYMDWTLSHNIYICTICMRTSICICIYIYVYVYLCICTYIYNLNMCCT